MQNENRFHPERIDPDDLGAQWNREDAKVARVPLRHLTDSSHATGLGRLSGSEGTRVNQPRLAVSWRALRLCGSIVHCCLDRLGRIQGDGSDLTTRRMKWRNWV